MPFLRLECPTTWIVQEGEWDPARNAAQESVFTLSNGYLGIRGYPEEPFDAGPTRPAIHIAGIFDRGPDGAPEMVEITNFLAVEIQLGGLPFRLGAGNVSHYSRVLGLKRGILQRSLVYTEGGRSTRLEFERFVSLSNLHVVGQSITVTPLDWRGEIVVRLWLDARGDSRVRRSLKLVHAEHMGRDRLLMATQTEASLLRIAHACRCSSWVHQGSPARPHLIGQGDRIGFELMTTLEPGQQAAFERLISTYTSRDPDTDSVERGCLDDVRGTEGGAYGVRRRLHVQALQRRWEHANIEIEGPEEDQRAVRFAVFQLMQHAPPRDLAVSIGARGLSGDGHGGCISWGTELAMLPFFASTNPPAARQLLRYRTATLEGAKRNAQAIGCQGALFAWESADTGDEAGPGLAAGVQPHVDAAVAYAAWQYFEATGDTALRERELLTLAVGTARFWASRVTSNPARKGYDIRAVSGPDETGEPVDNSAYTNFMAAWNLRLAVQEVDRMRRTHRRSRLLGEFGVTKEETLRWTAIADSLYLPAPSPEGVWEQYEGFLVRAAPDPRPLPAPVAPGPAGTPPQDDSHPSLLKHPDLLLLAVLFPDAFEDDWRNANWAYYEPRTTHDAVPSPCIHSIAASDIGLPLKAYAYFRKTAFLDLENSPGQAAAGLHMAALGGTWLAVARGFMGLDLTGDQPRIRPRLPENWRRLSMQIQHHGRWYRLEATGNDGRVQPCLEDAPPEERPLSAVPAGLNQTATDQHPDSPTGLPAKENEP